MASIGTDLSESSTASEFGPGVPPLPPDATPEQKDEHWFKHVYQGDRMPQLTVRSVLMGGILGMLMAASNLYTTLAIGWAFGVAITACVMSFVIWNAFRALSGGGLSKMSVLENNCMASTASAAGYSTGSTLATMFGALLMITDIPGKTAAEIKNWDIQPIWVVTLFTFCTGLMGVFLAIPLKRQMINHEQLRFPSGVAAAETLRSLYSESVEAVHKAYVLISGMAVGAVVGILNTPAETLGFLDSAFAFCKRIIGFEPRLPEAVPEDGFGMIHGKGIPAYSFEPSVLLIAAGVITRMRVCISMFAGSLLLYAVVGPALVQSDIDKGPASGWSKNPAALVAPELIDGKPGPKPPEYIYDIRTRDKGFVQNIDLNTDKTTIGLNKEVVAADPAKWQDDPDPKKKNKFTGTAVKFTQWSLWGGTALMVFASLTAVALQWKTISRAFLSVKGAGSGGAAGLAAIEVPTSWMIAGMIPITIAMLFVQIVAFNISWWAGLIAIAMSFFLSLVACRATGETDTTPIGAMGKVMQLIFAVFHPGAIVPNLASAGIAANSASSASDLLTDLKSGYLLGANPRKQFLAQFVGVFFGTIAIIPIWYLMIPDQAAIEKYAAPGTRQWAAVAQVLTKGIDQLPITAQYAALCGALLGVLLPILERVTPAKYRGYLPSAMGLGLSWVIPFSSAIGFFSGAVVGWLWEKFHAKSAAMYAIALASGLIAGESLIKAVIAMSATAIGLYNAGSTPPTP
ncbi:MAG: OPT family oligopeptide transporter [Phycisphaerales bacterium]